SISSGPHREPAHKAFAKIVEDWDIVRVISDFADAAERMKDGGMDGIEIEAYGHLIDQFWSPLTNTLDGPYGSSSLQTRMQFGLDVLDAIRDRVGPDFIVGIRYTADEAEKGGITPTIGLEMAQILKATGKIDFFNVIRGRVHSDPALTGVIPLQGMASAPHLDFAGSIRAATGLPTFHAARIPDVATARHAIASGLLDMVGMTRAHMADPHIVQKIMEGREDDIRPCVGATYCLDRIYQGGEALCIHNAATGRELSMPHVISAAETRKNIVIVGAGPAGLEAARVCAERGHAVTVFEAADQPGGQIRLTIQTPRKREMIGIIDWRMAQCAARDVTFHFNSYVEAAEVTALSPDVVIVATGGLPNLELFETRREAEHVISTWDILSGDVKPAGRILIYDESGDNPAMQAAEMAAEAGAEVEVMTPDRSIAPDVMGMNLTPYLRNLQNYGVRLTVAERLLGVTREGNQLAATIGTDYSDFTKTLHYDQVVVNYGTRPLDDLYFELRDGSSNRGELDHDALIAGRPQTLGSRSDTAYQLFRIGDAVSSRNTHAAIYDALRLCHVI
ncbi:MAG: FAD-dependent oxidoreductase, partial [Pseudomonadota bacterium]